MSQEAQRLIKLQVRRADLQSGDRRASSTQQISMQRSTPMAVFILANVLGSNQKDPGTALSNYACNAWAREQAPDLD